MRVVVSQFEGIDMTPALPLAAGTLIASARLDPEIARAARMSIALRRRPISDVVAGYRSPDLLGFSLYPWNAAYSLAVASAARSAYPESLIVAGGPSVPRRPERARKFLDDNPGIDVLVLSEGEIAFRDLLRAHLLGQPFDGIDGIVIALGRDSDDHRFTDPPRRIQDFAATASPFLDGTFDDVMAQYRDLFTMAVCESNRGCPFSCTFCDWSLTKHIVEFPIERVRAELDWVVDHQIPFVMMADANFGIRRRDTDLARYLAELRGRTGLPTSFYFYLTKNDHARNLETIEILQAADIGCWVGLAVQDFDDQVLESVKRDNIQSGESMELRRICGERGIPTFNELIFGLPGQTYDSFTRTIAQAMPGLPRHDFSLYLCRMIDNTELADPRSREEFAIETRRCVWKTSTPGWDPVIDEYQELVVATRDLPLEDWQRTYRFSYLAAAFYNLRLLRVVLHHVSDLGVDLRDHVAHLADRTTDADPGTVYAAFGAVLDRYVTSILSEGPFLLPTEPGAPAIDVDTALATVALGRFDEFLGETEVYTRDICSAPTLAEAFAYQSLITPRWGQRAPVVLELGHDWPSYVAAGGTGAPLLARRIAVRYVPPPFTSVATASSFATTAIGCIRARLDIGTVTESRHRLHILPATSGGV